MDKSKRVLVVATSRKTRGGITSVVKAHELGQQWHEFQCKWIETHIDRGNGLKIFYFLIAFVQFLFIAPFYSIIHIHVASYQSLRRKMFFFMIAKFYRKKVISHFHPPMPEVIFEKKNQKLYKKMFLGSDKIIVLSPQWQKWLNEALCISENVQVLYNPCPDIPPFEKDYSKKYILFAGSVIKRKGYSDLIKGFSKIAIKYPDWSVVLAGNGEIDKGEILAKKLGIEKQIEFVGWVNGVAKDILFKNASVFCLTSSGEGFPMAVLDAWAYGLPVICTPVGGLPDIVENEVSGLIFEYGDTEKLAEQLEMIINDECLRMKIANKSRELAITTFNLDYINHQLKLLYQGL